MKSRLTLTFAIAQAMTMICLSALAQTESTAYKVTTGLTNKNILLEEFTGIHCGYCPQGHAIASTLKHSDAEAYVVAIHAGYYSTPGLDEPDFRTPEGTELDAAFSVAGYPSGMINRALFGNTTPVISRSSWISGSKIIAKEDAPLNLLLESTYDGNTGKLEVHVEGYFTAEQQSDSQQLCVAWTQDNVKGPQNGANMGDDYIHNNMLRGFITPVWGDELTNPCKGDYFSRDYSVVLPQEVNEVAVKPEDIRLVAFVINGKNDVLNVTGGKPTYLNYDKPAGGKISAPRLPIATYYGYKFFELTLTNTSDKAITGAAFDIEVNGVSHRASWNGNIPSFESAEITLQCDYDPKEKGQNEYAITLTDINGESVTGETISGDFTSPIEATPTVKISIQTNQEASDNTFAVRDADGKIVKEFGPYADGTPTSDDVEITLEENKVYCMEVSDRWGDGIYSPRGHTILHSSDGSIIEQIYDIAGFGARSFFRTSKNPASVARISSDNLDGCETAVYTLQGIYCGSSTEGLPTGLYISVTGGKVEKVLVK